MAKMTVTNVPHFRLSYYEDANICIKVEGDKISYITPTYYKDIDLHKYDIDRSMVIFNHIQKCLSDMEEEAKKKDAE